MQVVPVMERLVNFFTEWYEVFRPTLTCSEVRIVRIELEPIPLCQAIEHGIDHIVQFYAEATVNARMVDKSPMEGTVDLLIGRQS